MSAITRRVQALLAESEPFKGLPEETLANLLRDVTVEVFKDGQVIIEQGSMTHRGLFVLESGSVRLMDVAAGHLIKRCTEGDFFGAFGLLRGGPAAYEARAVETTVCALLDARRFAQLAADHAVLRSYFERAVGRFVRRMSVHVDVGGAHLLFSRRLDELALRVPVVCAPDDTAQDVARRLTERSASLALVVGRDRLGGVVSDADFRRRFAARGLEADLPVRRLASGPAATISADASLFSAVMQMLDRRVQHLVVVREKGRRVEPVGILTDRDVAHYRGKDPLATVHRIDRLESIAEFGSIREETNEQLQSLFEQGVPPEQLSRLMSSLYDRVAVRLIELAAQEVAAERGAPSDVPWVWMRVGSGGRQEMVPSSEQHHALLYGDAATGADAAYFEALAERVTEGLAVCGLSAGDLVAGDPRHCMPLKAWKRRFREWVLEADRDGVVEALRFFDQRGVYGDMDLLATLREDLEDALNVQSMDRDRQFIRMVAAHVLTYRMPRNVFERYLRAAAPGRSMRFDLNTRGILPTVEAARCLALELRYFDSANTFDRLRRAAGAVPELRDVLEGAHEAYRQLVDFRLEHQLNQVEGGAAPDTEIDLSTLSKVQQQMLRQASDSVAALQGALAKRYDVSRR